MGASVTIKLLLTLHALFVGRAFAEDVVNYTDLTYKGCYLDSEDRMLSHQSPGFDSYNESITVIMCANSCRRRGYLLAGVQSRYWCLCGDESDLIGQDHKKVQDNSTCDWDCPGDPNSNYKCGGPWKMNLYTMLPRASTRTERDQYGRGNLDECWQKLEECLVKRVDVDIETGTNTEMKEYCEEKARGECRPYITQRDNCGRENLDKCLPQLKECVKHVHVDTTYYEPKNGDYLLDRCMRKNAECDQPPAERFCKLKGKQLVSYEVDANDQTKSTKCYNGYVCLPSCGHYRYIKCR